jgi:hypothetical protein
MRLAALCSGTRMSSRYAPRRCNGFLTRLGRGTEVDAGQGGISGDGSPCGIKRLRSTHVERAAYRLPALRLDQPSAARERFFRIAAGLDKQDLKRYSDFINQKVYDLLLRAEAAAKVC